MRRGRDGARDWGEREREREMKKVMGMGERERKVGMGGIKQA